MHLPGHDHRVDDVAAVVDRDVAGDLDLAGVAIHLDLAAVGAERERAVRRVEEHGLVEPGGDALGHVERLPGAERDLLDRDALVGTALDRERTTREVEVVDGRLADRAAWRRTGWR